MELCTARTISNITRPTLFSPHQTRLRLRTSLPFNHLAFPRSNPGLLYYTNSSVRSTTSEDTSGSPSQYVGLEPGSVAVEDEKPSEKNSYPEIREEGVPKEVSPVDDQVPAFEFLDNLDIKDCYLSLALGFEGSAKERGGFLDQSSRCLRTSDVQRVCVSHFLRV
ncbi:uncharacterized protein LOC127804631 isoform X2 [Diospyros lotus]|uniref:uncharacterized protein LOC127804631 isoform X2 n=1 Tax=Diospyros lotus TaxID=55363 RepID=UPI00225A7A89|nr:uncharacterized protein LOC127804631 isoform X2 [Diospyros lotus]